MSTKQQSPKRPSRKKSESDRSLIYWIVGGVVGLALIVWLAAAIAGEDTGADAVAFGTVTVEGDDLPVFDPSASDPAIGITAPTVTGEDWNGNQYTIGPDGRPKIIVMVAHWCPHCQRDVPVLQQWIDDGGLPDDVDMYAVTVLTNRLRDGSTYPPSKWLESVGWTLPTLMDDEGGSIASAYGLTSTPTYVVLDGENKNLGRIAGEIGATGPGGFDGLVAIAEASISG
jgi:cytochrome c biogenesis protein CcmG/thiol:disulfide interchange protein DsbE